MRKIVFDKHAYDDLLYWAVNNKKKVKRILDLIKESAQSPFKGRGKPEPLKYDLSGCWSRRIDREHRLVYEVREGCVRVLACRYHY